MPLNPNKPWVQPTWMEPYRPGETRRLESKFSALPGGDEAIAFQRQRRMCYSEFWTFNVASQIAWRETEERFASRAVVADSVSVEAVSVPGPVVAVDPVVVSVPVPAAEPVRVADHVPVVESVPEPEPAFQVPKGLDFRRDVLWVYQTVSQPNVRVKDAPSPGAWALRQWAREYRTKFFESFLPRAMKGQEDLDGELVIAEELAVEELRKLVGQTVEAFRGQMKGPVGDVA